MGNNWTDITGDLPDIPINNIIKNPISGDLYIATDIGVYYSINDGVNWELLGTDLPNVVITDLDYHPPTNQLIAASYGRGMFKIKLEEVTDVFEVDVQNITDFNVFPNPFPAITNASFIFPLMVLYTFENCVLLKSPKIIFL